MTGFIAWEGASLLTRDVPLVVIVTGESTNTKTGPMWQSWILRSDLHPVTAVNTRQDGAICGQCVHRGYQERARSCYVNVAWAPAAVYRSYKEGKYARGWQVADWPPPNGRALRMGAYGDPAAVPYDVWKLLAYWAGAWTGYTHQWRVCDQRLARFCMASVDSREEYFEALKLGWRTFRVRTPDQPAEPHEIICPASEEAGHATTCAQCLLCSGTTRPRATNIVIQTHGSRGAAFFETRQPSLLDDRGPVLGEGEVPRRPERVLGVDRRVQHPGETPVEGDAQADLIFEDDRGAAGTPGSGVRDPDRAGDL